MMNTETAMGHAVVRIKEGSPSDRVIAEIVDMGASEETAKDAVDRVLAMKHDAQARDVAVSLLTQGKSAAEVWEALVSSGVKPAAAEALVNELSELCRQAEDVPMPASNGYTLPVGTSGGDGWVQVNTGSFGTGLVLGCFCGLWAFFLSLLSHSMGSETKRGIRVGFAVNFGLGILIALMRMNAPGGR